MTEYEKPRILSVTARHVAELECENAKLREQLQYELQTSRSRLESIDHLKKKNEKLRELVAELYQCSRQYGCDRCGYKDGCAMFDRMAQLGIEVDG